MNKLRDIISGISDSRHGTPESCSTFETYKLEEELKAIEKSRRLIERAKQKTEEIPKQFFNLGEYYYSSPYLSNDKHDDESLKKAFYWYSRAAEQGHTGAQCMLGTIGQRIKTS